ncbi:MAG: c-type cytochrome [Verrucomicrobia bacterium]|nr:c-type cytochrome [Verrucomicrobiota bacterium]
MSDNEQRYYSAHRLNIVFTLSSFLFLGTIVAMFWKDYDREWRTYQMEFRQIEMAKAEADLALEETRLQDVADYSALKAEVLTLEAAQTAAEKEMGALEKQRNDATKALDVAMEDMNFDNADVSAFTYKFEQARQHGDSSAADLQAMLDKKITAAAEKKQLVEQRETELADIEATIKNRTAELTEARRKLNKVTARRDLLVRQLSSLDPERMSPATRIGDRVRDLPVLDMMNPRYNIRDHQTIVNGITEDLIFTRVPRVDRCTVCHLAIDKPGFEDQEHPFRTHPNLETFLAATSPHPMKAFGCTSCHAGRGRGTSFTSATHMPDNREHREAWEEEHHWHQLHHWDRPMYPAKYTEAGCYQCHAGGPSVPGAEKLNLGLALIERAGCYACHEIEAFKSKDKPGPNLQHIASKTSREWVYRWLLDPQSFREHTWMPAFFNQSNQEDIKDRTDQEIHAIVHYLFEKGTAYAMTSAVPAGDAARGADLVRTVGCQGCHMLEGESYDEILTLQALRRQHGPQLSGLGSKTTAAWVYNWIKDPTTYHASTRMPNLRLSDAEAADMTAYLVSLSNAAFDQQAVPAPDDGMIDTIVRDFMGKNLTQAQTDEKLAAMSRDDKQLYAGEKLIRRYGCFGCHNIPGFENARPIGTPLTEEGSKPVAKLDFGLQHHIEHLNYAWFEAKLENPRVFDEGLEKAPNDRLRMPNFYFDDQEIGALVTALLAFTQPDEGLTKAVPRTPKNLFIEDGERLVRDLNCRGCHEINGEGGAIRPAVEHWLANVRQDDAADDEAEEDDGWGEEDAWGDEDDGAATAQLAASYSPPSLDGQGAKVQPDWLFHFLQAPTTIRPWIEVRMPTFGLQDDELNTLVKYFNYLDDQPFPFASRPAIDTNSPAFMAGHEMFSPAVMNCARCHINAGKVPEGMPADNLAPDLAMARERLKPDWIVRWLQDPQSLLPGTKMPQFWPVDGPSPTTLLDGDSLRQREAVRDYVFSLSED